MRVVDGEELSRVSSITVIFLAVEVSLLCQERQRGSLTMGLVVYAYGFLRNE